MTQNPYILFASPRSPFARRIRLLVKKLGVPCEIKMVDVHHEDPELVRANPLGMVPTLLTPEGFPLSDSANLLEYFHDQTGLVWPHDAFARTEMRQVCVWTEGVMTKAVEFVRETILSEVPSPIWVKENLDCIRDTLALLAKLDQRMWMQNETFTIAGWDLCIALEYLDLRVAIFDWRKYHPEFVPLLEKAKKDPGFAETHPPGS